MVIIPKISMIYIVQVQICEFHEKKHKYHSICVTCIVRVFTERDYLSTCMTDVHQDTYLPPTNTVLPSVQVPTARTTHMSHHDLSNLSAEWLHDKDRIQATLCSLQTVNFHCRDSNYIHKLPHYSQSTTTSSAKHLHVYSHAKYSRLTRK